MEGKIAFDRYEYNFENTNLHDNPNLSDGLEYIGSTQDKCSVRDVPDLIGTWIERDESTTLDPDSDGTLSAGDIIVTEDSEIRNRDNPYQSGIVSSWCTVLDRSASSIYCMYSFDLAHGYLVFGGKVGEPSNVAGSSGCFSGVSAEIAGNMYDDVATYGLSLVPTTPSTQGCFSNRDLRLYWTQTSSFNDILYGPGANAGDKLLVDAEIRTYSGVFGRIKGVCTYLPSLARSSEFCTLSFDFDAGSIDVVGQYSKMAITGTSGCFRGMTGYISGSIARSGATYRLYQETSGPSSSCTRERFRYRMHETGSDVFFDIDKNGDLSIGDSFLFDSHPVNTPSTSVDSGIAAGVCTLLGERYHAYCLTSFDFPEGQIVTAGYFEYQVVIGGTGCYSNFRGMFYGRDEGDGSFSYNVVEDL